VGEDRHDEELPPLTKTYGSKPCSTNEYWKVGGRGYVIGWEKGRGDKERKGRTRNEAKVSGSRMSMILLRLSIDSPLRASDDGTRVRSTDVQSIEHTL